MSSSCDGVDHLPHIFGIVDVEVSLQSLLCLLDVSQSCSSGVERFLVPSGEDMQTVFGQ